MTTTITVESHKRTEMINITDAISRAADAAGKSAAALLVFVPHTTAAVTINENADPDVVADMEKGLDRLAPWDEGYLHAEGNSAAHIKSTLVGASLVIPLRNRRLVLGQWQAVFFCEFDGPRTRRVNVHMLS